MVFSKNENYSNLSHSNTMGVHLCFMEWKKSEHNLHKSEFIKFLKMSSGKR